MGRRKSNKSKKEGNYLHFVSLLNIDPYNRQKRPLKPGMNFKEYQGGG